MSYLGIKFTLPKPAFPVDKRELTVSINGEGKKYILPGSAELSEEFVFADTDTYVVSVVDIDQHGNRSAPSDALSGMVSEDARPPKPGPIGPVVAVNKRHMTDAEAAQAKLDIAKKATEAAKAEAAKADQLAKDEQARKDAHAKIESDAAKKTAPVAK